MKAKYALEITQKVRNSEYGKISDEIIKGCIDIILSNAKLGRSNCYIHGIELDMEDEFEDDSIIEVVVSKLDDMGYNVEYAGAYPTYLIVSWAK